jgi:hypothetical protein
MDAPIRTPIIQVSFPTQFISFNMSDRRRPIEGFVWEKMVEKIDPFWHSDNDEIQYFFYYNDDTYFCQKRKLVYDFATKSQFWKEYVWKEPTSAQAKELAEFFTTFSFLQQDISTREIETKINAFKEEKYIHDRTYYERIAERNNLLTVSDWRVLPDAPQAFEGERDMWIQWRTYLREMIKKPSEFENNLEFFKYIMNLKYPIDPRQYFEKYPDMRVPFMDENDEEQWSNEQNRVSKDFMYQNIRNIVGLIEDNQQRPKLISKQILDIAKRLQIEEAFPGLDLSTYTFIEKPIIDPNKRYIKPIYFPEDFAEPIEGEE